MNYYKSAKRKTSICNIKPGTLEGLYFKNIEYNNFSDYQKNLLKKIVPVSYEEIILKFPSLYSKVEGGGQKSQFESFCYCLTKVLKEKFNLSVTSDSRVKLPKKFGGRGARARRQKSYR
jgi:ribosomal protein S9